MGAADSRCLEPLPRLGGDCELKGLLEALGDGRGPAADAVAPHLLKEESDARGIEWLAGPSGDRQGDLEVRPTEGAMLSTRSWPIPCRKKEKIFEVPALGELGLPEAPGHVTTEVNGCTGGQGVPGNDAQKPYPYQTWQVFPGGLS